MMKIYGHLGLKACLVSVFVLFCSCSRVSPVRESSIVAKNAYKMSVVKECFGKTAVGEEVHLFTLTNVNGLRADITNYGAAVIRLLVPDRNDRLGDVRIASPAAARAAAGLRRRLRSSRPCRHGGWAHL